MIVTPEMYYSVLAFSQCIYLATYHLVVEPVEESNAALNASHLELLIIEIDMPDKLSH